MASPIIRWTSSWWFWYVLSRDTGANSMLLLPSQAANCKFHSRSNQVCIEWRKFNVSKNKIIDYPCYSFYSISNWFARLDTTTNLCLVPVRFEKPISGRGFSWLDKVHHFLFSCHDYAVFRRNKTPTLYFIQQVGAALVNLMCSLSTLAILQ